MSDNKQDEEAKDLEEKEEESRSAPSASVVNHPLPLDWTQTAPAVSDVIRLPYDVADIDPQDDELIVVGTAGQKITKMGLDLYKVCSPKLIKLILRSHLIRKMEGLESFQCMELLELYDNQIEYLESLEVPGRTLRVLDMSYNVIREMKPVELCPHLQELYLANNKLKTMAGLKGLSQLRKIDLGANRIRVMDEEELSGLVSLEELWLGKNKIEDIQGLEKLKKLRRLDIQSNRLRVIRNLSSQVDTLEELYLAHNGITSEGLTDPTGLGLSFAVLSTLDLSRNKITESEPLAHLATLEELWLSGNEFSTFDSIQPLSSLAKLEGIYLEYNPVASEFDYRIKLREFIPSLTQIDATMVGSVVPQGIPAATGTYCTGETLEQRMRRLQGEAVNKAKAESSP